MKKCNELAYFRHYAKHTYYVVLAWKLIQGILISKEIIDEEEFDYITKLIIWHDNSKIGKEEWLPYARKFYPLGNQDTNNVKNEFKEAVKHHKNNNFHHFESLQNYKGPDWRCYIIEMICDYIAMGWEFGVYIFEYYNQNKEKIILPLEYKEYLEQVLEILKDPSMSDIERPMSPRQEVYLELK